VLPTWRRWRRDLGNADAMQAYTAAVGVALISIR
jgi:hypothetical protein